MDVLVAETSLFEAGLFVLALTERDTTFSFHAKKLQFY